MIDLVEHVVAEPNGENIPAKIQQMVGAECTFHQVVTPKLDTDYILYVFKTRIENVFHFVVFDNVVQDQYPEGKVLSSEEYKVPENKTLKGTILPVPKHESMVTFTFNGVNGTISPSLR